MHGKYQLGMSKGPFKSLYLRIFTGTNMYKDNKEYDLDSSNWHLAYRPLHPEILAIQDSVIDLCKRDVTHELFGLTYTDLMDLDYPTYIRLRTTIIDICKEKEDKIRDMKKTMETTHKGKT